MMRETFDRGIEKMGAFMRTLPRAALWVLGVAVAISLIFTLQTLDKGAGTPFFLAITGCLLLVLSLAQRTRYLGFFWLPGLTPLFSMFGLNFSDYYIAVAITFLVASTMRAAPQLYSAAAQHLLRTPLAILLTSLLLLLGWSAHVYKQKSQYWYGLTEAIFATVFIIDDCQRIVSMDAVATNWGTLLGAVYFLARGLNNLREGKTKRRGQEHALDV